MALPLPKAHETFASRHSNGSPGLLASPTHPAPPTNREFQCRSPRPSPPSRPRTPRARQAQPRDLRAEVGNACAHDAPIQPRRVLTRGRCARARRRGCPRAVGPARSRSRLTQATPAAAASTPSLPVPVVMPCASVPSTPCRPPWMPSPYRRMDVAARDPLATPSSLMRPISTGAPERRRAGAAVRLRLGSWWVLPMEGPSSIMRSRWSTAGTPTRP